MYNDDDDNLIKVLALLVAYGIFIYLAVNLVIWIKLKLFI